MSLPLDGIRVLDFTRILAGPYATMSLADLGADVVKVEAPGTGDDTRRFGPPFVHGVSTYFLSVNRGKRSIALDLKSPEGQARARALARVADVVIENFRPGVMERLGLGFETLMADNPRLVCCSISGFGRRNRAPGYDVVIQGLGGIPALTGPADGPPFKCGASIADLVSGLNAVQGILAALLRRERTGKGAVVEVSMIDGQRSLLTYHAAGWLNAGAAPRRWGNQHPSIHPYGTYRASDGWFNLAVGNDHLWASLCGVLGRPDLVADPRFARNPNRVENREALDEVLEPLLAERSVADWCAALGEAGIPVGAVNDVPAALEGAELAEHEHPEGRGTVRSVPYPVRIDDLPRAAVRRAPRVGEHTDEVLAEWLGTEPRRER